MAGVICICSYSKMDTDEYLSDFKNCQSDDAVRRRSLLGDDSNDSSDDDDFDSFHHGKHAAAWVLGSLFLSLVVGLGLIKAFERFSEALVFTIPFLHTGIFVVAAVFYFAVGAVALGIIYLFISGLVATVYFVMRHRLKLVARFFSVASKALQCNPGIMLLAILLWIVVAVTMVLFVVLLSVAFANGKVVPVKAKDGKIIEKMTYPNGTNYCVQRDRTGSYYYSHEITEKVQVKCCEWEPEGYAVLYIIYLSFILGWTIFILFELRVFSIAGTVTQWYFAPPNTSTKGTLMRSLGHALGPSFGTIIFGGLVLWFLAIMRFIARYATRGRGPLAIICCAIRWILLAILDALEYLTRFATIWAAAKGHGFVESGRKATDLLKRNFLQSVTVWWFPPFALFLLSLTLSGVWCAIVAASSNGFTPLLSFLAAFIVISFTNAILLNVLEAVYFCYAIDKDTRQIHNEEVHEIFQLLPVQKDVGVLIEHPQGELVYAPPGQPAATAPTYAVTETPVVQV